MSSSQATALGREFARRWVEALHAHEFERILELFAPEPSPLEFYSPVVFKPYTDRKVIFALLSQVVQVLEDLTYTRVYVEESEGKAGVALFFVARVKAESGYLHVEGVDFFRLNSAGQAVQLKVMLRPLKSVQAVFKEMGRRLMAAKL